MENIRTLFTRLTLLLVAVYLAACAPQVNMRPVLSKDSVVAPGEGMVVARIVNASGGGLPFNQLTIAPDNVNASKAIKPERLLSARPALNGTTVFASPIKAGHFSLSSIRAFHSNGNGWYSRYASTTPELGTFEVKPGAVTDLGTLIYYPKPQEDRYLDLVVRAPGSEPGEVLSKHFPFYSYDEVLSWLPDDNQGERENAFISVAQNPITYTEHIKAPDGSLYFLGKLGVILRRDANGAWSIDAVDTLLDLSAMAVNQRGDMAVGGSEGKLFIKYMGQQWQDISFDHPYHIEQLLFRDDDSLDLLATKGTSLFVYRASIGGQELDWSEINQYALISGWSNHQIPVSEDSATSKRKFAEDIYSITLFELDSRSLITVRTQSNTQSPIFGRVNRKTFEYDPASWSIIKEANELKISSVVEAGNATLGIKMPGFWSWDGRTDYFIYRENSGWSEMSTHAYYCSDGKPRPESKVCSSNDVQTPGRRKTFTLRTVPWFVSPTNGLAIVSFNRSSMWSAKREYEVKILDTNDGGNSWTVTDRELPLKYCSSIIPDLDDVLLLSCSGATGDFYESYDRGETWEHVRQQENF